MRPDGPRDPVAGPDSGPEPPFPLRLDGKVIKGFGRGSKELGIPTANIPLEGLSVGDHTDIESGVYYGWAGLSPSSATDQDPSNETLASKTTHAAAKTLAGVGNLVAGSDTSSHAAESKSTLTRDKGAVFPMVMSIGWNPFYKNTVRSVEVHIMHAFERDFYGCHMNLVILGFIRPEYDYVSKESLIEDIRKDVEVAGSSLARSPYARFRDEDWLLEFGGKGEVAS
ncbi:hypothetical protein MBLNU230_g8339t1 [Neophaeotheca triangularis]